MNEVLKNRTIMLLTDWRLYVFGGLFLFILFFEIAFAVPKSFPTGTIITLARGESLNSLAKTLEQEGVIGSAFWFRAAAISMGGERGIQAGDYYLPRVENGIKLAWRMVHAERDLILIKLTIPEGFTKAEVADLFDARFPLFDKIAFVQLAREGYIFPDTYFVQANATAVSALELFQENYEKKVAPLRPDIKTSKHTEDEIIDMASILEAEVKTPDDMALVSGIMWKRISLGMALQVDSASSTYKVTGLPKLPLDNPGLNSINAAIHPKTSQYLYFISDKSGTIHYARTIDEQTKNIQKYL